MPIILGISAYYHDAAAALVVDGEIVAAAQEERFTRIKHTADFPINAIKYCLEEGGFSINELNAVVFYDKPLLKFERLLETYYAYAPKGLISFMKAIPVWINEKLFLKKLIYEGLKNVEAYNRKDLKLLFSEHHLSHAASAYYPSGYDTAAILTIDGVGEWSTASISVANGSKITTLKEMNFPHSVGLLYSSFTSFLGFKVNSGEYKLMGLAPYGDIDSDQTARFISQIKSQLVDIKEDGSIWLNSSYFKYATGLKMISVKKWVTLFDIPLRKSDDEILQHHCNLALAIQLVTEEIVIKLAKHAKELTRSKNLCLAGGVALNCVANGRLSKERIFDNIFIQPASGDSGGALGAALAVHYMYFNNELTASADDHLKGSYLGPSFSKKDIVLMNRKMKAVSAELNDEELFTIVAKSMQNAEVVGWFQGRMEFGPRALGNRSILGDACNIDMQSKINLRIKYREDFRPFAPSVLEEMKDDYFDIQSDSPYMLLVAPVLEKHRIAPPTNYADLLPFEKLKTPRSKLQAITHLDYSARIQTVKKEVNPKFWNLIMAFKNLTGKGLVVNTSFNVRGEPIVCTPEDAFRCFMSTDMDILVIDNFFYKKVDQFDYTNKEKWKTNFAED